MSHSLTSRVHLVFRVYGFEYFSFFLLFLFRLRREKLIAAKTIYRGSLKKELNAFKLLTSNSLFTLIQIMHEFARLLAFSSGLVSVHTKKSALVATQMCCYKPNIQSAYWPDVSAARATKVNKRKTNVVI